MLREARAVKSSSEATAFIKKYKLQGTTSYGSLKLRDNYEAVYIREPAPYVVRYHWFHWQFENGERTAYTRSSSTQVYKFTTRSGE
jgi:hypothetical protein